MDEGHPGRRAWRGGGGSRGPFVSGLDWDQLWAYGRIDLGLSDHAFWHLTLYELDVLSVRHRRAQAIADRRAAMAAWVLVNVNRDSDKRPDPFTLDEVVAWLGHGFHRPAHVSPPEGPPTPEALKGRIDALHLLHKGLYGENGQHDPHEGG